MTRPATKASGKTEAEPIIKFRANSNNKILFPLPLPHPFGSNLLFPKRAKPKPKPVETFPLTEDPLTEEPFPQIEEARDANAQAA